MLLKGRHSVKRSCTCKLYVVLLCIFFLLYQYARASFYADPTSYFFNPAKAYRPGYSDKRQVEASAFLANDANLPFKRPATDTSPKLCIGIASIAREGANYLHLSAGSILEGLTAEERAQVSLKILIAHTDPTNHSSWESPWLRDVADEVLSYKTPFAGVNATWLEEIEKSHEKGHESQKGLHDYAFLLSACIRSGAEYILMVEDDTVAARGWYAKSLEAISSIERKIKQASSTGKR